MLTRQKGIRDMKINGGRYRTVTKFFNKLIVHMERRQKRIKLRSFPYLYIIDIGDICNLRCPLCATGSNSQNRTGQFMSFENYKKMFDKLKKYAYWVYLYNWGDPLLNRDLFRMVEYTRKNNVGVLLSTNFNVVSDEMLESIVKSQVDRLTLSIDGADQRSYEAYRKNGDFDTVLSNLKKLLAVKKEFKSESPVIIWQYLVNKKNESSVPEARRLAGELGVDIAFPKFQLNTTIFHKGEKIDTNLVDEWITDEAKKDVKNYTFYTENPCEYLYFHLVVNPDGRIVPCCGIDDCKVDFGNLLKDDLETIWNNKHFLSARSLFTKKEFPGKSSVVCDNCSNEGC